MATHVVVTDSGARSTTISVSPNTALSDVLRQACSKRKLDPDQYGLKFNSKSLDLSLTWRLASLPRSAKLDLVQASRSPSVVTVGLQLPDGSRLTSKFPSNTSLWKILRVLEDKGDSSKRLNLTQRETAPPPNMTSGSGRLFYAQPVLNFMGREFAGFTELQRTLAQLGFGASKGNLLLRIDFRNTGQPLEEAMVEIDRYFKSVDSTGPAASHPDAGTAADAAQPENRPTVPPEPTTDLSMTDPQRSENTNGQPGSPSIPDPPHASAHEATPTTVAAASSSENQANSSPPKAPPLERPAVPTHMTDANRPTTILLPIASHTPRAATSATPFNEADYTPTIDHAKQHQARLAASTRNTRLASSTELADQESARLARLAALPSIELRIRLPDQTQVLTQVTQSDTAADLYNYIRQLMADRTLDFSLRYLGKEGRQVGLPDEGTQKLIRDLEFGGKVLLTLVWQGGARVMPGTPVLREDVRKMGSVMKVEEPKSFEEDGGTLTSGGSTLGSVSRAGTGAGGKQKLSGAEKEGKLKGLLMKGFAKK